MSNNESDLSRIDPIVFNSTFLQTKKCNKSLRITCYGSSSSETPIQYMNEARSLGYIIAQRGHVCINGAGAYGCMAAMNDGAYIGNGHIIGVIHEMWLTDQPNVRDGGAHPIFTTTSNENAIGSNTESTTSTSNSKSSNKNIGTATTSTATTLSTGGKYEMLVATGNDLQERKRLLVENTNAVIVLPGGPGTWDELWEMVCARGIGLSSIPIIIINCNQYYDPFYTMLERAYHDKLMKYQPTELVHFVTTAQEAVEYIESISCNDNGEVKEASTIQQQSPSTTSSSNRTTKKNTAMLRSTSIMHTPTTEHKQPSLLSSSSSSSWTVGIPTPLLKSGLVFTMGMLVGTLLSTIISSSDSTLVGRKPQRSLPLEQQ